MPWNSSTDALRYTRQVVNGLVCGYLLHLMIATEPKVSPDDWYVASIGKAFGDALCMRSWHDHATNHCILQKVRVTRQARSEFLPCQCMA